MERVSGIRREKHLHLLEVLFLGCFVIGIIAANLYGRSRLQQYGILNDYFIQQLKYITIEKHDYFIYVLSARVPVVLTLIFFGMTPWYRVVNSIFLIWSGFSFGFLCVMAISNIGAGAIWLMMIALCPQFIFYVSGYLLLLKLEEKYQCGKEHGKLGEWILLWGIILLLFFIGFLTEAYLNPGMVHFVLKKR